MVTDLGVLRVLGEAKQAENVQFRRFLKAHHFPERGFSEVVREVEEHIDCTACANCCRETTVNVSPAEVAAIAGFLSISPADCARLYTERQGEETLLRQEDDACVFLDENLCMVYEARPAACRNFPYVLGGQTCLVSRMESVCRHASFCPILYNALEQYKKLLHFPRPHHSPGPTD